MVDSRVSLSGGFVVTLAGCRSGMELRLCGATSTDHFSCNLSELSSTFSDVDCSDFSLRLLSLLSSATLFALSLTSPCPSSGLSDLLLLTSSIHGGFLGE